MTNDENDKGKCNIKKGDFISCQLIGIDFNNCYIGEHNDIVKYDDNLYFSFEDAKKDDFLKNNCSLINTTVSQTKELNRFRAFFILPSPIVDPHLY